MRAGGPPTGTYGRLTVLCATRRGDLAAIIRRLDGANRHG